MAQYLIIPICEYCELYNLVLRVRSELTNSIQTKLFWRWYTCMYIVSMPASLKLGKLFSVSSCKNFITVRNHHITIMCNEFVFSLISLEIRLTDKEYESYESSAWQIYVCVCEGCVAIGKGLVYRYKNIYR